MRLGAVTGLLACLLVVLTQGHPWGEEGPPGPYDVVVGKDPETNATRKFRSLPQCSKYQDKQKQLASAKEAFEELKENVRETKENGRKRKVEAMQLRLEVLGFESKMSLIRARTATAEEAMKGAEALVAFEQERQRRAVKEAASTSAETSRLKALITRLNASTTRLNAKVQRETKQAQQFDARASAEATTAMKALLTAGRVQSKSQAELFELKQQLDAHREALKAEQERVANLEAAAADASRARGKAEAEAESQRNRQHDLASRLSASIREASKLQQEAERMSAQLERDNHAARQAESTAMASREERQTAEHQAQAAERRLMVELEAKARIEKQEQAGADRLQATRKALEEMATRKQVLLDRMQRIDNNTKLLHDFESRLSTERAAIAPNVSAVESKLDSIRQDMEAELVDKNRAEKSAEKSRAAADKVREDSSDARRTLAALKAADEQHIREMEKMVATAECDCSEDEDGCARCFPNTQHPAPSMPPIPQSVLDATNMPSVAETRAAAEQAVASGSKADGGPPLSGGHNEAKAEAAVQSGALAVARSSATIANFVASAPVPAPEDPLTAAERVVAEQHTQLDAVHDALVSGAAAGSEAANGGDDLSSAEVGGRDVGTLRFRSRRGGALRASSFTQQTALQASDEASTATASSSNKTSATTSSKLLPWTKDCKAYIAAQVAIWELQDKSAPVENELKLMKQYALTVDDLKGFEKARDEKRKELETAAEDLAELELKVKEVNKRVPELREANAKLQPRVDTAKKGVVDLLARASRAQLEEEEAEAANAAASAEVQRAKERQEAAAKTREAEERAAAEAVAQREHVRTTTSRGIAEAKQQRRNNADRMRDAERSETRDQQLLTQAEAIVDQAQLRSAELESRLHDALRVEGQRRGKLEAVRDEDEEAVRRLRAAQEGTQQDAHVADLARNATARAEAGLGEASRGVSRAVDRLHRTESHLIASDAASDLARHDVAALEEQAAGKEQDITGLKSHVDRVREETASDKHLVDNADAAIMAMQQQAEEARQHKLAAKEVAEASKEDVKTAKLARQHMEAELDVVAGKRNMAPPGVMRELQQARSRREEIETMVGGSRADGARQLAEKPADVAIAIVQPEPEAVSAEDSAPAAAASGYMEDEGPVIVTPKADAAASGVASDAAAIEAIEKETTVSPESLPGATGDSEVNALLGRPDEETDNGEPINDGAPKLNSPTPPAGSSSDASPASATASAEAEGDTVAAAPGMGSASAAAATSTGDGEEDGDAASDSEEEALEEVEETF